MKSIVILCLGLVFLGLAFADDNVEEIEFKRNMEGDFILNCSLPANEVEWYKNGTLLVETETLKFVRGENGIHMLKNSKPKMADTGSYTCQGKDARGASMEFRVAMEPYVSKFTSSSNVVEGETLKVTCTVNGYPIPTVEWRRLKEEGGSEWNKVEADGHFQLGEANGYVDSVLIISNATMQDRGEYMCYAENTLGSSNSTVLIRVIDKYAALWPFLGICAEVVVLCAVIFIFEKRRGKKQVDEPDNEQNNAKHVVNAKDSEVRNRK